MHLNWVCELQWADGGGRLCSGTGVTPGAAHAAAIQEIHRWHPQTLTQTIPPEDEAPAVEIKVNSRLPNPEATRESLAIEALGEVVRANAAEDSRDVSSYTVAELVHEAWQVLNSFLHGQPSYGKTPATKRQNTRQQVSALKAFIQKWGEPIPNQNLGDINYKTINVLRRLVLSPPAALFSVAELRSRVEELVRQGKEETEVYTIVCEEIQGIV